MTYLMMFMQFFFPIFFVKAYIVGTHLNCIYKLIVDAIQIETHNISLIMSLYRSRQKVSENYGHILLDCELKGICAVIRRM